jgi:nitrogen fixation/metabolism regulation signal transduction histidine kinase
MAGLLGLPLLLTACGDTAPPADVAQRYLENIRDSAYAAAYDLLSSDSQLKVSRSQFVDRLTRAKTEAGITHTDLVKVQPPNIVGKRASVAYQVEVTTQDNRKTPLFESLVLLQQDNGWRVVWPPQ